VSQAGFRVVLSVWLVAAQGCAIQGEQPLNQGLAVGDQARIGAVSASNASATIPGYILQFPQPGVGSVAVEYARGARGNATPLRVVKPVGVLFGADKRGQIYSADFEGNCYQTGSCRFFVQDATGVRLRTITIQASAQLPQAPFVDMNGSIYYVIGCTQVAQLAVTANRKSSPIRRINVSKEVCNVGPHDITPHLFADTTGNVYLFGPHGHKGPAWYIWSQAARGSAKPSIISNPAGVAMGVDKSGKIWTIGLYGLPPKSVTGAWIYDPPSSGNPQPQTAALPGLTTPESLRIASTGLLVYVGENYPYGQPTTLVTAEPGATQPRTILNFAPAYTNASLLSVTF
jgi:hypothetical protein